MDLSVPHGRYLLPGRIPGHHLRPVFGRPHTAPRDHYGFRGHARHLFVRDGAAADILPAQGIPCSGQLQEIVDPAQPARSDDGLGPPLHENGRRFPVIALRLFPNVRESGFHFPDQRISPLRQLQGFGDGPDIGEHVGEASGIQDQEGEILFPEGRYHPFVARDGEAGQDQVRAKSRHPIRVDVQLRAHSGEAFQYCRGEVRVVVHGHQVGSHPQGVYDLGIGTDQRDDSHGVARRSVSVISRLRALSIHRMPSLFLEPLMGR